MKGHHVTNKNLPDLGDPMTQLYYDLIQAVGRIANMYSEELNEDRIWILVRKMDVIYQQHMREILEEVEDIAASGHRSDIHPGAQAIIDRLLRESGQ